ncbi:MAG: hypothetical protein ACRD6U_01140 [Nitrososphaeraceae archaeon]
MVKTPMVDQDLSLVWEPVSLKIEVGSYLTGKLQNNSSENFRGISLCPLYSNKQLRKIHRRKLEKANIEDRKSNRKSNRDTVKTAIKNKSAQEVMYQ